MKIKHKEWCEFDEKLIENRFYAKLKEKLIKKTYSNGQVVYYKARVPTPSKQFVRCPKCNKRLQLIHTIVYDDNYLYICSHVSKHKKWVKNGRNSRLDS